MAHFCFWFMMMTLIYWAEAYILWRKLRSFSSC